MIHIGSLFLHLFLLERFVERARVAADADADSDSGTIKIQSRQDAGDFFSDSSDAYRVTGVGDSRWSQRGIHPYCGSITGIVSLYNIVRSTGSIQNSP